MQYVQQFLEFGLYCLDSVCPALMLSFIVCRNHLDLLEKNKQLILELKHLDNVQALTYVR